MRIYGAAVWNHWLDSGGGGYGADAIRRAWEVSDVDHPTDFALAAYDRRSSEDGGKGFSREFAAFAAATAEWRSGFGGFPDRAAYPDVKRKGSLAKGGRQRFKLDHTAYRLLTVRPRGGKLKLSGPRSTRACARAWRWSARDGDALSGNVTRKLRFLEQGRARLGHARGAAAGSSGSPRCSSTPTIASTASPAATGSTAGTSPVQRPALGLAS